jgi:zinc finger SWIM domain-containing protein 3
MTIDYNYFGDVIIFNITYSTNRDVRSFDVFLGFNYCKDIVVFGTTLLYDEIIESFVLLFEIFVKAMSRNKSINIFID